MYSADAPGVPTKFVVKLWPDFELLPPEVTVHLFRCDMMGYAHYPRDMYFPRPGCYLATYDHRPGEEAPHRCGFVMDDLSATHTLIRTEDPLSVDDVLMMIPRLVDVAVAFEGCHDPKLNPRAYAGKRDAATPFSSSVYF